LTTNDAVTQTTAWTGLFSPLWLPEFANAISTGCAKVLPVVSLAWIIYSFIKSRKK
jgi:hypothetical protein